MSGGRRCSDLVGIPDLVPFDMGGTSTDISLISAGRPRCRPTACSPASASHCAASISQASPQAAARSPASMPAAPCGGTGKRGLGAGPGLLRQWRIGRDRDRRNVVLGYLDAAAFMGGKRPLDRAARKPRSTASRKAWICPRRGRPAIYRMINLNMADGIRLMTLRRARRSAKKFVLLSFGGAAGLHAAEVARELEIKRIIVPTVASVLSAWGMLTSDLRYEVSRTHHGAAARISADEVRELFAELEQQATGRLRSWFNGPIAIERSAEMRYGEQNL